MAKKKNKKKKERDKRGRLIRRSDSEREIDGLIERETNRDRGE